MTMEVISLGSCNARARAAGVDHFILGRNLMAARGRPNSRVSTGMTLDGYEGAGRIVQCCSRIGKVRERVSRVRTAIVAVVRLKS